MFRDKMELDKGSKLREVKSSIPDLLRGSLVATEFEDSIDWLSGKVTLEIGTT